jgi:hypothetical protein
MPRQAASQVRRTMTTSRNATLTAARPPFKYGLTMLCKPEWPRLDRCAPDRKTDRDT